jgi:hypothetical protein
MSCAKPMTASVTLHSVPDGTIAGAAAESNNSICIGGESKGYNQSEGCEDSIEMHGELDWQGLLDFGDLLNCWRCNCRRILEFKPRVLATQNPTGATDK